MNRKQALEQVGRPVSAYVGMSGTYVGVLEEITEDRPWRGKVRVTSYLEPATCFEQGRGYRRGFRIGEWISVGGVNIEPTEAIGEIDYVALLDRQATEFERRFALFTSGEAACSRDGWMGDAAKMVRAAAERIRREALPLDEQVQIERIGSRLRLMMPDRSSAVWTLVRTSGARFSGIWNRDQGCFELPDAPAQVDAALDFLDGSDDPAIALLADRLREFASPPPAP